MGGTTYFTRGFRSIWGDHVMGRDSHHNNRHNTLVIAGNPQEIAAREDLKNAANFGLPSDWGVGHLCIA
jgi:hypothetical protein